MNVNSKQVGGEHYRKAYQHWDLVCDANLHYLIGCATKYIARHKEKNGRQDLEKSIHYLEKAIEKNLMLKGRTNFEYWNRFMVQMTKPEREIYHLIYNNQFQHAISKIHFLITEQYDEGEEPTRNYITG